MPRTPSGHPVDDITHQRGLGGCVSWHCLLGPAPSRSNAVIELDKLLMRQAAVPSNSSQGTRARLNKQKTRVFIRVMEHDEPRATEECRAGD